MPVHEKDFGKGPSALGKQSEAMDGLEQLSKSCLTWPGGDNQFCDGLSRQGAGAI